MSPANEMMSRLSLPDRWSKFLEGQEETGMGFQDVEVTLADGRKMDAIALNGEFLETLVPLKAEDISSMRIRSGREVGRWAGDDGRPVPRTGCCATRLAATGKVVLVSGGDHHGDSRTFECEECHARWHKDAKGRFWR